MNDLTVINHNGVFVVDSMSVAKAVGKMHNNLVRDIDNYVSILSQNSNLSSDDFFIESSYTSGTGKNYKCYLLTKKGCDLIAHKMTGKKGTLFSATFVDKFYAMEDMLREELNNKKLAEAQKALESSACSPEVAMKVGYYDTFISPDGCVDINTLSKIISSKSENPIGRNNLFKFFRKSGLLNSNNSPTAQALKWGVMVNDVSTYKDRAGNTHITVKARVTQKGINKLPEVLDELGIIKLKKEIV